MTACSGFQLMQSAAGQHAGCSSSRLNRYRQTPNTPENLVHWIRYPRRVDEDTAMPYMNVSERDARDIIAFLYTLR